MSYDASISNMAPLPYASVVVRASPPSSKTSNEEDNMPRDTREPQEILAHVPQSRVALTSAIYGLSEVELTMEGPVGRWSVKDVMAHLGRWEEICFAELQKHLRGEQPTGDYRDALPYNDQWESELQALSL